MDIQRGLRWFILSSDVNKLPAVPFGKNDYGFDGMIKATHGWLAVYNHDQKFNDHWDGFFNFGMQRNDLDKMSWRTEAADIHSTMTARLT